jgi:hypothetical protein
VTTALDLITGALRRINSYAPGEVLSAADSSDALDTLNELLDSWSTEHEACFGSAEYILNFTGGQYVYTIGQAEGGTFQGTVTSGSAVITGVTVPSALKVGGLITDSFGAVPPNTYVLSIGANSVTLTQAATVTPGAPETITYKIPGDFYKDAVTSAPVLRPLRITHAFTRITTQASGLDYPISIITQDEYTRIGFKGIAAPWPIAVWYNPTMPLGTLSFYQNPSGSGQLHLFSDLLLTNLGGLTNAISMPQGYVRWIKWALAKELAPEYGAEWTATHERNWKESRDVVHSLNAVPAAVARIDAALINPRGNDAGWIMHGGWGRQ